MKKRILFNGDGSIGIITPAIKSKKKTETEDEWLTRVFEKATPQGAVYKDYNEEDLPTESVEFWSGSIETGVFFDQDKKNKYEEEESNGKIIQEKIRDLAISELKKEGKLSDGYK